MELLVEEYFNANLSAPNGNERDKAISAVMETEGLEDMAEQFLT